MKKLMHYIPLSSIIAFVLLTFSLMSSAVNMPSFPGAEGFGRYTTGGRGGAVYHVTSLADDGSVGTLRWAINNSGTRTVVFDVSGTIHLTSALAIKNNNITLAGQTAPGDGICVADYPFTINASNVIIRFMRFRLGNKYVAYHEGDGLGGMDQQDIMVDHCSVSWSIDECLSVYGMKNSTVQWCIASQSLRNSGHTKGAHGYGGNWGGSGASYHHNLLAHHDSRTPRLGPRASTQTDERMDFRNNVIYNWGGNGCYGGEGMNVNMVNNFYKPGPGTKQRSTGLQYRIAGIGIRTTSYVATYPAFAPMLHVWGDYYVDGNHMEGFADVTADNWTKGIYAQISNSSVDNLFTQATKDTLRMLSPVKYLHTTTQTPELAYDKVLKYAGASLSRDWVDSLMISDTRNGVASHTGTGSGDIDGIIDSQNDNQPANAPADWDPWPKLKSAPAPLDTDRDGMPDAWETAQNLNPNDASDRNKTNTSGYTLLEVYMNSLVEGIMTDGNLGGVVTGVESLNEATVVKTTLSQSTYTGASGAGSPWTFNGGFSITNNNSKAYSTGSNNAIKFSSNVQFTVLIPENTLVDSVSFVGYDNYNTADSYLSEVNGVSFTPDQYVFLQKDASGNAVLCTQTVPFSHPASGSFSFTFSGNQTVVLLDLFTREGTTGHDPVRFSEEYDSNKIVNVFSVEGRLIRSGMMNKDALSNLPAGIYIVDHRKRAVARY